MAGLTIDNPVTLTEAFASNRIIPGDVIKLRAGTYTGVFNSRLSGVSGKKIWVTNYENERVVIDGGITQFTGGNVIYDGLEFTNSSLERVTQPEDRPAGLTLAAPGVEARHLVVHNVGHPGIGFWGGCVGSEIYGCVIYHNGIYQPREGLPNWTRGSAIYAQGQGGQLIEDTITFRNFTTGGKSYGEGARISNFTWRGVIAFDNASYNLFIMALLEMENITLENSVIYSGHGVYPAIGIPYINEGVIHANFNVHDNYVVVNDINTGYYIGNFALPTFKNNVLVNRIGGRVLKWKTGIEVPVGDWNNNTYYGTFDYNGTVCATIADWRTESGWDADSTMLESLSGVFYQLRIDKYDANKAYLAIANHDLAESVNIDVSSFLEIGDTYQVIDAQNYFGDPVAIGENTTGTITIPVNLTEVAVPVGNVSADFLANNVHTGPFFNALILKKT